MKIVVRKQAEKKIAKGYPLIREEDLVSPVILPQKRADFVTADGTFLGRGYLGKQNKGIGWLLTNRDEPINKKFFTKLIQTAKDKRHAFFHDESTTAFRVFNGEGDGIGGVTIDWYDHYAVFSWYNEAIHQEAELILAAFQSVYPEILGASEKIRFHSSLTESSWLYGKKPDQAIIVRENYVHYAIYLNEGLMTGIFLDQKEVRDQLVSGLAAGQTVLNLFSYTGAFSVAAAMGGAITTTSVDLAKRSRSKTEEQFKINNLPVELQKIIVMDVFDYFKYAERKNLKYDLIILDPPSFARNKKKTFSVAKNYGELIAASLTILNGNGRIIASTNAANLSLEKFRESIENEFSKAGVSYELEKTFRLPQDFQTDNNFPEGNYLKVMFYQVNRQ